MLHESIGILHYDEGYRLTVEIEQELADYYQSLIPKWFNVSRQRWPAHITVVRSGLECPVHLEHWGKYQDEQIVFTYDSDIKTSPNYFWLNTFSVRLEEIRLELGLPVDSIYTRPPDGFLKCFHTTIGNIKGI